MSTIMILGQDINGNVDYDLPFAEDKYSCTLLANNEESFTVPANFQKWKMVFSYEPGAKVWVSNDDTAEVPAGNTFVATTSELNPAVRYVSANDEISFITDDASAQVGFSLYAAPYGV